MPKRSLLELMGVPGTKLAQDPVSRCFFIGLLLDRFGPLKLNLSTRRLFSQLLIFSPQSFEFSRIAVDLALLLILS